MYSKLENRFLKPSQVKKWIAKSNKKRTHSHCLTSNYEGGSSKSNHRKKEIILIPLLLFLYFRSGSFSSTETNGEGVDRVEEKGSPAHSPSTTPRLRDSSDLVLAELSEVRAFRDKLQAELVRRRGDNETLQQQLVSTSFPYFLLCFFGLSLTTC